MTAARALGIAGLLLALATLCGALGAHTLRHTLGPAELVLWDTAVRFQFFQSLGLLGVALALRQLDGRALRAAALLLLAGVVLFCGSLYALALGAPRFIGVLTPLGGLAWIAAWLLVAYGALRH
jgi:uncharacterized membrane protein YgdD (TMEM256/DUF423 family)